MTDLEKWVQCSQCDKWRCVPDDLSLPTPWLCKYNVFDNQHNKCSHEQETMPIEEDEEEEEEEEEEEALELVPEEDVGMFTPSTCSCTTCSAINASVRGWKNTQEHPVPLINMVLQAITKTEPIAHAVEEDKQFIRGVSIDLHHPGGPNA